MKEFLKDYGSLVGPLVAFTLGVIALFIKYFIDRNLERHKTHKKYNKLFTYISNINYPPAFYEDKQSTDEFVNIVNFQRLFNKVKFLKDFSKSIESDVNVYCSENKINKLQDINHQILLIYNSMNVMNIKFETETDATLLLEIFTKYKHIYHEMLISGLKKTVDDKSKPKDFVTK